MTEIPRDLLCDTSGRQSARFLRNPGDVYGLHGLSTGYELRWPPVAGGRYSPVNEVISLDTEPQPEDGIFPPSDLEFAKRACEAVVVLCQRAAGSLRHTAREPHIAAE